MPVCRDFSIMASWRWGTGHESYDPGSDRDASAPGRPTRPLTR